MSAAGGVAGDFEQFDLEPQGREFDPNTRNTDGLLWHRTEELRMAMQNYRSFFRRLLSI